MSGLALADPALGRAVGSEVKLSLSGSASLGGDIAFDALSSPPRISTRAIPASSPRRPPRRKVSPASLRLFLIRSPKLSAIVP